MSNPFVAIMLDKLFCDLGYLRLVGAQNLTYTKTMFQLLQDARANSLIVKNPLPDWPEKEDCQISKEFSDNDVQCGLLGNYGDDLTFLLITLAINICMTVIGMFTLKRINKKIKDNKDKKGLKVKAFVILLSFARSALNTLDIRFFVLKLDGNVLEIIFFGLMNIFTFSYSVPMLIGLLVSLVAILYYVFYCYVLWMFARQLRQAIENRDNNSDKKKAGELLEAVETSKFRFRFVSLTFDGFRYPLMSTTHVFFPIASLIRYILIAMILATLNGNPKYIPFGCTVIEFAFYIYALKTAVKESKLENWIEQFNSFVHVIYNILGIISFSQAAKEFSQPIDYLMMGFLGLKLGINTIIVVGKIVIVFYQLVRYIIKTIRRTHRRPERAQVISIRIQDAKNPSPVFSVTTGPHSQIAKSLVKKVQKVKENKVIPTRFMIKKKVQFARGLKKIQR